MKKQEVSPENCQKARPVHAYSHLQELIDNLPYILMTILGALVFIIGLNTSATRLLFAGGYVLYGIAGAFWIIVFVCPYCHFYGIRACPCGYGQISALVCEVKDQSRFNEKFKKHIPVIVPLWIIPVAAGVIFLIDKFSPLLLILLLIFAVDAFLVLPLVSKKYGCAHCPQKTTCPWMTK